MRIDKLNKELYKLYKGKVFAKEDDNSFILSGNLDNYDDILKACYLAVDRKSGKHVVNDIVLNGAEEIKIREPLIENKELDGQRPDVLIIGGGISGASILRELSKWKLNLLLVDKEPDLANQASGRNDGEIHPGVDLSKGTLKQKYVKKGNRMYDQLCKDLDVPFKRIGQYACFTKWYDGILLGLFVMQRKYICGIDDTKLVGKKHLRKLDSKLNPDFRWAIYNPMAGVVSPYELTIAYGENAISNGAHISLNTIVRSMEVKEGKIIAVHTNKGTIYPKLVINAAGVFADDVAKMANDRFYSIHPRKGTDLIFDKKASYLINTIASKSSINSHSHTKGGGSIRTVHNNILCGPDAIEVIEKEDFSTEKESIDKVFNKQKNTLKDLSKKDMITYFSGIRAANFEEDYVICNGKNTSNLIHCACIQSPGLTTAPAVALDIEKMAVDMLKKEMTVEKNKAFNPCRKGNRRINELSLAERNQLIKDNPDYGIIVCRCEEISKGEITDALNSPLKVATIDGIKRRVRPGMGRCQGTFCMPLVAKIIAEHEGIEVKDVLKGPIGSTIGVRNIKEPDHE